MSVKKYLSKVAQNITPYQWEEEFSEKMLRFDTNTLPFPPPSLKLFLQEMESNCPINEYTDPSYKRLKKLIADYENVSEDMVTVTNSGDEAIDVLAKTFLDPGDYFITTPPTYEMFSIQCGINKGRNLQVTLIGKKFTVDEKRIIEESKKQRVKIIFLVNPNNPTASIISQRSIEKIIKNSDAVVVVDEVYREFYGKTAVPLLKKYENLVILRSFSKFAAMAGARIGYLVANPFLSIKFDAIRFPMGVSFLSYKLAEFVLEKDREWIKKQVQMIITERKRLTKGLISLGLSVYPSYANFLLVKIGEKASNIYKRLKEKGIIIRDRSNKKYLEGCVRITVRSPRENNLLLKTLKEIL
ncbi:histidinol-phosphate transaminase [Candidatus Gottesmanbacteria bacterium]|nr:histidinol-phosphate transaminase [Candidatus Gottesmanbacteria bacterium]